MAFGGGGGVISNGSDVIYAMACGQERELLLLELCRQIIIIKMNENEQKMK